MNAIPFDLERTPLNRGLTLLEAGAGSGKTYTIEGTFLRLLLEEELEASEILVVTFTEAATAELRDRIRKRLREALIELRKDDKPRDPALLASEHLSRTVRQKRLMLALESFDEAQIFTIHGFCQRILKEHAFETGSTFDAEIVKDDSLIKRQLERDFCRRILAPLPLAHLLLVTHKRMSDFHEVLKARGPHRNVLLKPDRQSLNSLADLEKALWDCLSRIKEMWLACSDEVHGIIADAKRVKSELRKQAHDFQVRLERSFRAEEDRLSDAIEVVLELTQDNIDGQVIKRAWDKDPNCVTHDFFGLCQEFYELSRQLWPVALHAFLEFADTELEAIKRKDNVLTFDDLLSRVGACLAGEMGDQLCKSLNSRYKAALVDEFQDTDGLQWSIFSKVFGGNDGPHFYIIGDPKQAIYRFRGADIHTYLGAAASAQRRMTLLKNWRSDAALIDGFNSIFAKPRAFLTDGIQYLPAQHCGRPQSEPFVAGPGLCDLPLRFIIKDEQGKPEGNLRDITDWTLNALTADIQSLLVSGSRLGDRPVAPRDVAVLVRTGAQAQSVQERLNAAGIPAVLETDASVFDSDEAKVLEQVLAAGLSPGNGGHVRAALAGPLFSLSAADLRRLDEEEQLWDAWLDDFALWHSQWEEHGFMFGFRSLSQKHNIQARILAMPRGERRMTNLLHLCEILHQAEGRHKLAPTALLAWLRDRIHDKTSRSEEEHQLRTESEGDSVRVLTMHKSKGLQFPFVFCPFMCSAGTPREHSYSIFNQDGQSVLYLQRFSELDDDAAKLKIADEELGSEIRLFYVALTRARHRCYIYLAINKKAADSLSGTPIGHILGADDWSQLVLAVQNLAPKCPHAIKVEMRALAGAPRRVQLVEAPVGDLSVRSLRPRKPTPGMLSSFSSLRGGRVEAPDREEIISVTPEEASAQVAVEGPYAFPRGPAAGNFFHAVFEHVTLPDLDNLEEEVDLQLKRHAIRPEWRETALKMCRDALSAPLVDQACQLTEMDERSVLREVEFYMPVERLDVRAIAEVFESHPPPFNAYGRRIRAMSAPEVSGYLKGFIDLVFRYDGRYYILDWKSNHLGDSPEAYQEKGLDQAILNEAYFLQYCLYTVALNRYLSGRVPGYGYETHFGGIRYVFLRGLNPDRPGSGIHIARPPESLISDLDATLNDQAMEEAI